MAKFAIAFYDKDNRDLSLHVEEGVDLILTILHNFELQFSPSDDDMLADFIRWKEAAEENNLDLGDLKDGFDNYNITMEYKQIY